MRIDRVSASFLVAAAFLPAAVVTATGVEEQLLRDVDAKSTKHHHQSAHRLRGHQTRPMNDATDNNKNKKRHLEASVTKAWVPTNPDEKKFPDNNRIGVNNPHGVPLDMHGRPLCWPNCYADMLEDVALEKAIEEAVQAVQDRTADYDGKYPIDTSKLGLVVEKLDEIDVKTNEENIQYNVYVVNGGDSGGEGVGGANRLPPEDGQDVVLDLPSGGKDGVTYTVGTNAVGKTSTKTDPNRLGLNGETPTPSAKCNMNPKRPSLANSVYVPTNSCLGNCECESNCCAVGHPLFGPVCVPRGTPASGKDNSRCKIQVEVSRNVP